MSRVHETLDGERPTSSLDAAERADAAALEHAITEAVELIRGEPAPDLRRQVMARVRASASAPATPARRNGRWLELLWAPRSFNVRIRPALAAAAVLAVLLPLALLQRAPEVASTPDRTADAAAPSAAAPVLYIQFRLDSPGAQSVALAGSFTDWSPRYELRETDPGVWSVIVPLEPGVHDYGYLVDGERWVPDPVAPQVSDGFGGSNSQLAILPSGEIM